VQVEFLVVRRQEMSVKAGPLSRSESHWLLLVEAVRLVSDEEMLSSDGRKELEAEVSCESCRGKYLPALG
jgi:hypothetical protein